MSSHEPWSDCPAGELTRLQQTLKEESGRVVRRRRFIMAAGSATLAVAGIGIGVILNRDPASTEILSCQETIDLLPKYVHGTLTSVSTRKAVQTHLDHCTRCREYYEKTY